MKVVTVSIPFSDITATAPYYDLQAYISHTYVDAENEIHYENQIMFPGQVIVFNRCDGMIGINSLEGDAAVLEFDRLESIRNYYDFVPIQAGASAREDNSFNMTHLRLKAMEPLSKGDVVVSFYNYRT